MTPWPAVLTELKPASGSGLALHAVALGTLRNTKPASRGRPEATSLEQEAQWGRKQDANQVPKDEDSGRDKLCYGATLIATH